MNIIVQNKLRDIAFKRIFRHRRSCFVPFWHYLLPSWVCPHLFAVVQPARSSWPQALHNTWLSYQDPQLATVSSHWASSSGQFLGWLSCYFHLKSSASLKNLPFLRVLWSESQGGINFPRIYWGLGSRLLFGLSGCLINAAHFATWTLVLTSIASSVQ